MLKLKVKHINITTTMKPLRLTKRHIKVMMKIWLNAGRETNKKIILQSEEKEFNQLVESGYIKIVEKDYSMNVSTSGMERIFENFVENLEIAAAPFEENPNTKVVSHIR